LGNRSVIADPRRRETVRIINDKIKSRDFWMPFAPSVLKDRASEYLKLSSGVDYSQMTVGVHSTSRGKEKLCAALHPADDTARPQLVSEEQNPKYTSLIRAFEKETGVGAVLNTSLNIHGDPIARTAQDALHILKNTGIDGIVVGDFLILQHNVEG